MKKNCWEIKHCGREKNLSGISNSSICPAAKPGEFDGVNNGFYAGRMCWRITGTFCDGKTQASYVYKAMNCANCDVYRQIRSEEGSAFKL